MEDYKVFIETLGYIASVLIVISLTMKSFIQFRVINLVGAFLLVVYSVIIGSYPVALLNSFSVIINIYYLYQYQYKKDFFRIIPFEHDSEILMEFLIFYKDDILKYYPKFEMNYKDEVLHFFIFRNMVPSGLFIIKKNSDNTAEVMLDYVTKEYRDLMIGKFIYHENRQYFVDIGIMKLLIKNPDWKLKNYLDSMGFKKISDAEYEIKMT